jgi:AcrR family transcriptional regulator
MRHLAARADIDPGSLYDYIGSKQTLLWDIISRVYEDASECALLEFPNSSSSRGRTDVIVGWFFDWCVARADLLTIVQCDRRCLSHSQRKSLAASRRALVERLAAILAGEVSPRPATMEVAEMLLALGHAVAAEETYSISAGARRRFALWALGVDDKLSSPSA